MPKLDKPEVLFGVVTKYKGNGRALGYPTANINAATELEDGIYFGFADLAEFTNHPALIFVGVPVTVGDSTRRIEAHLFDIPDIDYYGQTLCLTITFFHRANKKFESVEEMLTVIKTDEATGRQWSVVQF